MSLNRRPTALLPTLLALAALAAVPAVAGETSEAAAPCPPAPSLESLFALQPPSLLTPAEPAGEELLLARPPFFKTCRCSCGAPCTTDADCWGGKCTSGITCCAAPGTGRAPVPDPEEGSAATERPAVS